MVGSIPALDSVFPAERIDLGHAGMAHHRRLSIRGEAYEGVTAGHPRVQAGIGASQLAHLFPLVIGDSQPIDPLMTLNDSHIQSFAVARPGPKTPGILELG